MISLFASILDKHNVQKSSPLSLFVEENLKTKFDKNSVLHICAWLINYMHDPTSRTQNSTRGFVRLIKKNYVQDSHISTRSF